LQKLAQIGPAIVTHLGMWWPTYCKASWIHKCSNLASTRTTTEASYKQWKGDITGSHAAFQKDESCSISEGRVMNGKSNIEIDMYKGMTRYSMRVTITEVTAKPCHANKRWYNYRESTGSQNLQLEHRL